MHIGTASNPRLAWAALVLAGCASTVPLQRASPVAAGRTSLGAQLNVAPWCGLSGTLETGCAQPLVGTPLPEVRASARRGLTDRMDAGASVDGSFVLGPGLVAPVFRLGAFADVKRALWRSGRWIVSAAIGGGYGVRAGDRRFAHELSAAAPLFVGFRLGAWELVASPRLVGMASIDPQQADPDQRFAGQLRAGLALAAIAGGGFGVQLGYEAPAGSLGGGALQLALGYALEW